MSQIIERPELEQTGKESTGGRWQVIIFNNPWNTVDEVVEVLMHATGCDESEAAIETWEAHHFGKASVHFANEAECRQAAEVISSIGVKTEVGPEWND